MIFIFNWEHNTEPCPLQLWLSFSFIFSGFLAWLPMCQPSRSGQVTFSQIPASLPIQSSARDGFLPFPWPLQLAKIWVSLQDSAYAYILIIVDIWHSNFSNTSNQFSRSLDANWVSYESLQFDQEDTNYLELVSAPTILRIQFQTARNSDTNFKPRAYILLTEQLSTWESLHFNKLLK